jgi:hypothetical protein
MRTVEAVREFVSFNAMLDGTRTSHRSVRVGCSVIKVVSERGNAVERHHPRSDQWSANPRARDDDAAARGYLLNVRNRKARATGLEPATTGSTVRYSNQLSYAPKPVGIANPGLRSRRISNPIGAVSP